MKRWMRTVTGLFFKPTGTECLDFLLTTIDGEFHGWSGGTHFALANGQVWQQSSIGLARHHALSPKVVIYRSGPVIKMHVIGVDDTICVRRVK